MGLLPLRAAEYHPPTAPWWALADNKTVPQMVGDAKKMSGYESTANL